MHGHGNPRHWRVEEATSVTLMAWPILQRQRSSHISTRCKHWSPGKGSYRQNKSVLGNYLCFFFSDCSFSNSRWIMIDIFSQSFSGDQTFQNKIQTNETYTTENCPKEKHQLCFNSILSVLFLYLELIT